MPTRTLDLSGLSPEDYDGDVPHYRDTNRRITFYSSGEYDLTDAQAHEYDLDSLDCWSDPNSFDKPEDTPPDLPSNAGPTDRTDDPARSDVTDSPDPEAIESLRSLPRVGETRARMLFDAGYSDPDAVREQSRETLESIEGIADDVVDAVLNDSEDDA